MSQKGNILLTVLIALLIVISSALVTIIYFKNFPNSNLPSSPTPLAQNPPVATSVLTPTPTPVLQATYVNPFDLASQYTNPFPNPNNPF